MCKNINKCKQTLFSRVGEATLMGAEGDCALEKLTPSLKTGSQPSQHRLQQWE
jgi:hypothetical protein